MRITFVAASVEAGGAQRVMSTMANYWAARDWDVMVITLSSAAGDWYALHPRIQRVGLNLCSDSGHLGRAIGNNIERIKRLRQELRKSRPDVVIAFENTINVSTLMAGVGLGIPIIVSERIDPRHHPIGAAWTGLRSLLYRNADALVLQADAIRDWAKSLVAENAIHIIPNPITPVTTGSGYRASRRDGGRMVVAMGRLTHQKGFDLLVRAFARCAKNHALWSLSIIGDGDERESLEQLIKELGLKDRVTLLGPLQNPTPILQGADVFVLSSRYEGFPNALLEAMACGLAVISTDCPSGPREIIRSGVDGILVPPNDVDALAMAMDRLMRNQDERQRLGARAVEVTERFSLERVMNMWDKLLTQTCQA